MPGKRTRERRGDPNGRAYGFYGLRPAARSDHRHKSHHSDKSSSSSSGHKSHHGRK